MKRNHYQKTFETWDRLANAYQDKFMGVNLYDDTYDLFCEKLKINNATVLEIGCGPGNITRYLLSKRPDFNIEATDVSPSMIALAKQNNPTANCYVLDGRAMDTISKKYDGIVCGFCMPYLSKHDVAKLFKDCALLLQTGGIFYFSAIEGDYRKSGLETSSDGQHSMYIYYHQANYLEHYLTENNFKLVDIFRKQYLKSDGKTETHIVFIAQMF